jgi:hypothetical protein
MLLAINWLLVRRLGALDRPFAETRSQCCRGLSGVGGVKVQYALGKACMGVLGGLMILRVTTFYSKTTLSVPQPCSSRLCTHDSLQII